MKKMVLVFLCVGLLSSPVSLMAAIEAYIPNGTVIAPPQPSVTAPTLTEWGMIILILLVGFGSIYYLKKRRIAV